MPEQSSATRATATPGSGPDPAATGAVASDSVSAAAAARLRRTSNTIAEKLTTWQPQLTQRRITPSQWASYEPLVRAAATCAAPSSETVASDLLGAALAMVIFAATRRMPLRAALVFRASTAEAYLATVPDASRATIASRVNALVAGIDTALNTDPHDDDHDAAREDPDGNGAREADGRDEDTRDAEPLLLDGPAPSAGTLRRLELSGPAAADALAALAAVRARVLEVEPTALRREERFRGKGRSVPYGDVEVVALLAAAATQRSTKHRLHTAAAICLGVGAGVTGELAASVRGSDLVPLPDAGEDALAVTANGQLRPVHAAFAGPLRAAAAAAGPRGWLIGGNGSRRTRMGDLSSGLANTDARLVRLNSTRLGATWLAMHAVRGVPLGDLLAAAGHTTAEPLTLVLPYLPPATPAGRRLLTGTSTAPGTSVSAAAPTATAASSAVPAETGDADRPRLRVVTE